MRRIWTAEEIEKIYAELVANHRPLLADHIHRELTKNDIGLDVGIKIMNVVDQLYPGHSSSNYIDAMDATRVYIITKLGISNLS